MVPLLPKLRGHFAEFLNHSSLDRLSILYPTTRVGLGYGRKHTSQRSFSRQYRPTLLSTQKGLTITPHPMRLPDLPRRQATGLNTVNHHRARQSHCVTTKLKHSNQKPKTQQMLNPRKGTTTEKGVKLKEMSAIYGLIPVAEYQLLNHRLRLTASP